MAPELTAADLSAAIVEAQRLAAMYPLGIPTKGPTARMKLCAELILKGKAVDVAMRKAGYGRKFIAGNADKFVDLLASEGLLKPKEAAAAVGDQAAAKALKPAKKEVGA